MTPSKKALQKNSLKGTDPEFLVDELEHGGRHPKHFRWVIPLIAGTWSLFQLMLPQFLLLSSEYVRCIHLAFAIVLVFLSYPAKRKVNFRSTTGKVKKKFWSRYLHAKDRIPFIDILLAITGGLAALYLTIDYVGIAERQGAPIQRDLVIGVVLIALLLEATRRALGLALPLIASLFICYSFFSESMPEIIAFKNATLPKVINKLTMGTEGIFGVPLDVSATTVFLFVLFGTMLEKAGGGKFFIQLAFSLLGRFKGGPAKAAVLASGLTGMISGSSIANTVTTGTFTIPLMKRAGYPGIKAGAIEIAASSNGQLMPPIMGAAAFIIAEYCGISYFEVVRAAIIPALVAYIALIYITHLEASKLGLKGLPKEELPSFIKTFREGIHFLIPLGFLLYQLIILRRSAQLSAYYAITALSVLMIFGCISQTRPRKFSKRIVQGTKTGLKQIWKALVVGGQNMMSIGVAVAAAGIIVGIVTLGLGGVITDVIDTISQGNIFLMLIVTAVVSLILGLGLPTTANYIVMASLTAPAIVTLAGDSGYAVPLIAAHLFVFFFGILADVTPPVGLAAYAVSAISKEDPIKTGIQGFWYDSRTALLPFMFIFNTKLLLIGVNSVIEGLIIFATAVVAMFSFTSILQNWFYAKNRIYESLILLCVTALIFRVDYFSKAWDMHIFLCYTIAVAAFGGVYAMQRFRTR